VSVPAAALRTTSRKSVAVAHDRDGRDGYAINTVTARGKVEKDQRTNSTAQAGTITYDAATGRLNTICSGVQSGAGRCNLQDLAYKFDAGGDLLYRTRANTSALTKEEFVNDAMGRLKTAKLTVIGGVTQPSPTVTNTLSYDLLGNICSKNGVAYTYSGRSGCAGSGTNGSPHAVSKITPTSGAATTYAYDNNGNQTTRSGTPARVLSYNALNQPASAALGTGTTAIFEYGPDGDRFRHADAAPVQWPAGCKPATDRIFCNGFEGNQTGGTATTLYVGNVEIIVSGSTKTYRRYLSGIAIDTVRSGIGSTAYVYTDHLGSLDAIANSSGALIAQMSFDVHGNRRDPIAWQGSGTIPNTTPRGFTGHEHLDTFGFIHMNGRLYDPVLGRMLQVDPLTGPGAQSLNGYSYVINNPLALTDPSGYSFWNSFVGTIVHIVIDAALYASGNGWVAPWVDAIWAYGATNGNVTATAAAFVSSYITYNYIGSSGGWDQFQQNPSGFLIATTERSLAQGVTQGTLAALQGQSWRSQESSATH